MKTIRFLRNAFLLPLTLMSGGYGAGMALSSNTITAGGVLSLLVGYIAWLATAYRMSFPAKSIWAWRNMSSNCSVSLC